MNLAQTYAEGYEYRPCAMARFAGEKIDFTEQFDLLGKITNERPVIRTKTQRQLWMILTSATRPLSATDIYGRFDEELTISEQSGLRHQMAKWALKKFLQQTGGKTRQKYSIRGIACPKL